MTKLSKLNKIANEIEECEECKKGKSGKAVVGEGDADADIVFIGEAPGRTEAMTGRPFVGRSGKLLRSLIQEAGLEEKDVYITSPVKYLPDRGTPTPSDIAHGKIHLDKQLDIIDPKIVVLLGSVAVQGVLGEKVPVMKEHGKIIERNNKKFLVTLHPAAGLRFPPLKKLIVEDFEKLKKVLSIEK